jgi:hypothetical protein
VVTVAGSSAVAVDVEFLDAAVDIRLLETAAPGLYPLANPKCSNPDCGNGACPGGGTGEGVESLTQGQCLAVSLAR